MTDTLSQQPNYPQYVGKRKLFEITNISVHTWKKWRVNGQLIEGIHWVRLSKIQILYCLPLILDWLHNHGDPTAHQKAIENYQSSLLSNQSKLRRSSSKKGR